MRAGDGDSVDTTTDRELATPAASEGDGFVGRRMRRVEDPHLLLGDGSFVDDDQPRRLLHACLVRSPLARAAITSIDTSAAAAVPGVTAVFTADDLEPVVRTWRGLLKWPGMVAGEQQALAVDEVRYVGEPIAVVIANGRAVAEDAAELVDVDYEPRDAIVDPVAALEDDAGLVHDEVGTNVAYSADYGDGDVDSAFADAHEVVELEMSTGRHTAVAIEPRGVVADYDRGDGTLTVRVSTQAPHMLQALYAELFDLPESSVRVLTDDVGGAFGMKAFVYPDEIAAIAASVLLGRRVKWIQDRAEAFQSDSQARDERVHAALALDRDGTILGLRCDVVSDGGAYSLYPRGVVTEGHQVCVIMPGPYRITAFSGRVRVAITNKPPLGVYRAVGHPPAILVMESLMDEAARRLGLDPAELRRRNLITPDELPYTSITGSVYDSGSHLESLERLVEQLTALDLDERRAAVEAEGRLLGVGLSTFVELSAPGAMFYGAKGAPITAHDQVQVRVEPDGTVAVLLGTPGQGQGVHTTAAQVVADHLGVPFERIRVVSGDTRTVPHGSGVWASRSAVVSAGAAAAAAGEVRARLLRIGQHLLEAAEQDLRIVDGRIAVTGDPEASVSVADVAETAYWRTHELPEDLRLGLDVVGEYRGPNATFNNGAHAAIVEVDPVSGIVRVLEYHVVEDCGVIINPDIVDGQIRGGVAQGIGGALYEWVVHDETGQVLTSTMLDYLVPTAAEIPDVHITHIETPSPLTSLGTKGVGEAGAAGAPAAVHNAVNDALARLGRRVWHQPITPERVVEALRSPSSGQRVPVTAMVGADHPS